MLSSQCCALSVAAHGLADVVTMAVMLEKY